MTIATDLLHDDPATPPDVALADAFVTLAATMTIFDPTVQAQQREALTTLLAESVHSNGYGESDRINAHYAVAFDESADGLLVISVVRRDHQCTEVRRRLLRPVFDPLARTDRSHELILRRCQGADPLIGVGATWIVSEVEVEHDLAVVGPTQIRPLDGVEEVTAPGERLEQTKLREELQKRSDELRKRLEH